MPTPELLRYYRVPAFDSTKELADSIAKKKGFMKKEKVPVGVKKAGGTQKMRE